MQNGLADIIVLAPVSIACLILDFPVAVAINAPSFEAMSIQQQELLTLDSDGADNHGSG